MNLFEISSGLFGERDYLRVFVYGVGHKKALQLGEEAFSRAGLYPSYLESRMCDEAEAGRFVALMEPRELPYVSEPMETGW